MRKALQSLQDEIGGWGDATFPKSTPETVLAHFREEVAELLEVAPMMPDHPSHDEAEEAADVFLLLLHFAHKKGFSLFDVTERKMAINRARRWNTEPEPAGHFKHADGQP